MNKNQNSQNPVPCPECDNALSIPENFKPGKIIECPACGTELEVLSLNPIQLNPLEEEK